MSNLTPEQIAEKARIAALTPAQKGLETKAKKAAAEKAPEEKPKEEEKKAPEIKAPEPDKDGFLNPFDEGVTYAKFVSSIPDGKTVAEYCAGKLDKDSINWISNEVEHFKNNQKK